MSEQRDTRSKRYPRLAVISANPIGADISNSFLMTSLISGWPRHLLSQVYLPILNSEVPSPEICVNYSRVGLFGGVKRVRGDGYQEISGNNVRSSSKCWEYEKKLVSFLRQASPVEYLRFVQELWFSRKGLRDLMVREVAAFEPEVLYAVVGRYSTALIVRDVCKDLGVPLCLQVTDDYVTSLYQRWPLSYRWQELSRGVFQELVDISSSRIAISPMMANEYSERYGGQWIWLTTAIDAARYDIRPRGQDQEMVFVYAGNIGEGRSDVLRHMAEALGELSAESEKRIRLDIYGDSDQLQLLSSVRTNSVVRLCGWCDPQHLPEILQKSDVLVYVESLDRRYAERTRLSLSTKISQYCMAGKCILAICCRESAVADVLSQTGCGTTLSSIDKNYLKKEIKKLVASPQLRSLQGLNGRRWAEKHAARDLCHARFRGLIAAAVTPSSS